MRNQSESESKSKEFDLNLIKFYSLLLYVRILQALEDKLIEYQY